ncbi:fimbrial protein [Pseudomonas carnis]|uniref:fimbrial protein n=1 Tax=Pseudomonas carnis TaxID=2487355 RepID=UPI001CA6A2BA|nr:fimbrial protein [Pseudomonas carnis]MBY8955599.1 fimbrial protein [Pseudomonas carnis]
MKQQLALTVLLVLVLPHLPAQAEENIQLYGTLVEPPPCTINDGQTIDIDFGDRLGVNKIDGVNYLQRVNYTLTCEADAGAWDMILTVNGTPTSFDNAAVQTNKSQLGIRLLQGGKPFILGTPIPIDPDHLPVLEVVPVQQPGADALTEGAFDATATLQADYQ